MKGTNYLKFVATQALVILLPMLIVTVAADMRIENLKKEVKWNNDRAELAQMANEQLSNELQELQKTLSIADELAGDIDIVRTASMVYNVPYDLFMAILRLESANFTSSMWIEQNNPAGIKLDGEFATFETKNIGVMESARIIWNTWISKGLETPEEIAPTYCPPSDEGCEDWAYKVQAIMNEYN